MTAASAVLPLLHGRASEGPPAGAAVPAPSMRRPLHLADQLPDRSVLEEWLRAAVTSCRSRHAVAVLCCDVWNLKRINERFGHAGGERVLSAVAVRLRDFSRGRDLVARLSGDEFAVVLTALRPRWSSVTYLAELRAALEEPVEQPAGRNAPPVAPAVALGLHLVQGRTDPTADCALQLAVRDMYRAGRQRRAQSAAPPLERSFNPVDGLQ